ncbi:tlde1 domain-containing protein [Rhizobium tubonense]|nr:tlde1 domain-containing protein [Rhizobium tubonense]
MAFATETFNDVSPFSGFVLPSRRFRGVLASAVAIGVVTASLAWMVATLATMQTMAVSLSPDRNSLTRVSLAPRTNLPAAESQGQRLVHVTKFSRLHPLLSADQQALSDAVAVAKGNRENATRKLAAAVVQNALRVALANAASRPVIDTTAVAAIAPMTPPIAANEKRVDIALAGSAKPDADRGSGGMAAMAVRAADSASLGDSVVAKAEPVTAEIGPMERAVGVALADAASPQADDVVDFVPPIPSARPIAAAAATQTASLTDDASSEDPFNLVMANAGSSSDEDPLDSVPLPAARPRGMTGSARSAAEQRFRRPSEPVLAYARADDGVTEDAPTFNNAISLPGGHNRVAVYDISAGTVYLPSGERLEAHSGLGNMLDNPRFVSTKNRGPTPPNTYALTLRESMFHGVQALRLTPIAGGTVYGRTGLLAHTYMLGRRGDSNGCVVFKDYRRFLAAFQRGEVNRMVVVPRLSGSSTRVASR